MKLFKSNKSAPNERKIDNLNIFIQTTSNSTDKGQEQLNKKCVNYKNKWQILSSLCCYKCSTKTYKNQSQKLSKEQIKLSVEKANLDAKINELDINTTSKSPSIRTINRLNDIYVDTSVCISSPLPQVSSSTKDLPKLYPPGRILHIVRNYSSDQTSLLSSYTDSSESNLNLKIKSKRLIKKKSTNESLNPIYQIIENDNKKYNELLISPRMIQDHMPDNLIKCMKAVLEESGAKKALKNSKLSKSELDDDGYDELRLKEIIQLNESKAETKRQGSKKSSKSSFIKQYFMSSSDINKNSKSRTDLNLLSNQAPLAKQESLTDISLNLDDLYFDDSINFITNKSNAYDDLNESKNLSIRSKRIHNNMNNQNDTKVKIRINCDYEESETDSNDINNNRTSTPRNKLLNTNDQSDKNRESIISSETSETKINENTSNSLIYSFTSSSCNLKNVHEPSTYESSSSSFSFNQTKSDLKFDLNNPNNSTHTTNFTSIEKLELIKPQSKDYILCFDTSSLIDQNNSLTTSNDKFNFNLEQKNTSETTELSLTNSVLNDMGTCEIKSELNLSNSEKIEKINNSDKNLIYDSGVDTARTLSPQISSPFFSEVGEN